MVDTNGWTATSTPTIGKLHIDACPPHSGIDPALAALMGNQNNGGMFGGANSLLPLLIGAFLFGGNRFGLGGMGGYPGPVAGAGAFAAEAVAAQSIYTPKDTAAQLNTFQSWAQNNAAQLAQQCCCSTQQVIAAVNGVSDKMFQTFVAQAQAQTAQLNNMQSVLTAQNTAGFAAQTEKLSDVNQNLSNLVNLNGRAIADVAASIHSDIAAGFAAGQLSECQTQNMVQFLGATNTAAITTAIKDGNYALATQIAQCCCEERLAIANQNALIERNTALLANQLNLQTCDIKQAIVADGQATRALITANRTADLEEQLNDAKSAVRDAGILAAIGKGCHHGHGGHDNGGGVTNTINVTDIATAVARALNQNGAGSATVR